MRNPFILVFGPMFFIFIEMISAQSSPTSNRTDILIEKLMNVQPQSVRIVFNPDNGKFYYSVFDKREIYEVTVSGSTATEQLINSSEDFAIEEQMGGMMYYQGKLYVAGSFDSSNYIRGMVLKGIPGADSGDWTLVAKTEPYTKSNTFYDHRVNAVELDPTGQYLLVNSGSRSDHGEETYGLREEPVTSCILKIPIDAENLIIPNDTELVKPFIFVDGTRNSFGIGYDATGNIFGTENSGDRDQPDEINWLRPEKHYGFPWNMGGLENPQQFSDYNPGIPPGKSLDPFIQNSASAWGIFKSFKNDSTFPPKPDSLDFILPIVNLGPDADKYRDSVDFKIKDASDQGQLMFGVTPHRSPAGIVFDREGNIGGNLRFGGFITSFNNSGLLMPFEKAGDILHLDMKYTEDIDNFSAKITQIVKGFNVPADVEIVGNELYVIEFSYGSQGGLWRITLPEYEGYFAAYAKTPPLIDGIANESIWDSVPWASINQAWVGSLAPSTDYEGKYKVCWNGHKLFFLIDIFDDVDVPMLPSDNALSNYYNYDNVELFIDENHSGGNHQSNHNAFTYHITPGGKAADICPPGSTCDLSNNIEVVRNTEIIGLRTHSTWEVAVDIYDDTFSKGIEDNSSSLVNLTPGKIMGFAVGSGDNDKGAGMERDNLFGSVFIEGSNKNTAWQTADVFDKLTLLAGIDDDTITALKQNKRLNKNTDEVILFPVPVVDDLQISLSSEYRGLVNWKIYNLASEELLSGTFNKFEEELTGSINCSMLGKGIYLIHFESDDRIEIRKFIR